MADTFLNSYWVDMVLAPRVTLQKIIREDLNYGKEILPFFLGFSSLSSILDPEIFDQLGKPFPFVFLFIISIVLAWPLGYYAYKFSAWLSAKVSVALDNNISEDVFGTLVLWVGYLYFIPAVLGVVLTLNPLSLESSITETIASWALGLLTFGLSAYLFILNFFLFKDTLQFNWTKTICYMILVGVFSTLILLAFMVVAVILLSLTVLGTVYLTK
jgi:hypothetical protein